MADRLLSHSPKGSLGINVGRMLLAKLDQFLQGPGPGRPPGRALRRGAIVNLEAAGPDDTLEFQFNPEELGLGLAVRYARLDPLGESHPTLQYVGTGAMAADFRLYFSATHERRGGHEGAPPPPSLFDAIGFLISLCYPQGNVAAKRGARQPRPPRVALQFGDFIYLEGFIVDLDPRVTGWANSQQMEPTELEVGVRFEEQLGRRLLSDQARRASLFRVFGGA